MASLNSMVKKVAALADTRDVSSWESEFIKSVLQQTKNGNNTSSLTEKQIDVLERIHQRHFAD